MSLPSIEPTIALELISRLGSDDAFRTLFSTDPAAALIEVGLSLDDATALEVCCKVNELASKADILQAKQDLQMMLTAKVNQIVPALDANPDGGHTLKGP
ncbi:putative modified peptide [Stenotrophomonas sp. SAM-B]|jgi:putative modified peptide|uniref:Putative modified peptide n=1 Tax=Stenotrophomonas maltophilia TaxID=40324 RepID=A0A246HKA9_STEMA|nr:MULTISPECIES: NHLP-related RiPP peptide [Stenotrophomonas]MBW8375317.1 NHLP-related RiPP peptide [Stenotrophomonas sp.]NWF34115.1 putative modified peptide [Stenotrophomonas sp. SAM-B]OWQ50678.1 putative modified peptide [Stenotrophomonas maltophilia]HAV72558.1 putative modified peptide [Stenotrophomonas sp.]